MSAENPKSSQNETERRELERYPRYHQAQTDMMIRHTQERDRLDRNKRFGADDMNETLGDMMVRHDKEKNDLIAHHEDYREKGY